MARADLFGLDEGATGAPRVAGPRTDTSNISEKDIYEAVRRAGIDLEVDPLQLAREAGAAGDYSSFNKMTPEQKAAFQKGRSEQETQERKFGTEDNPQPYDAPEGTHWNNYNGTWYLYNADNIRIGDKNGYNQNLINSKSTKSTSGNKTVVSTTKNANGTTTIFYSDGTSEISYPDGTSQSTTTTTTAYRDWETDRKSTRLNSSHRL